MNRFRSGFLILLLAGSTGFGQRIIYDANRDKNAQDAATAATGIGAGSVFQSMLQNVDLQSKQESDIALSYLQQQMRAKLQNFTYWSNPRDRPSTVLPGGAGIQKGSCFSVVCELKAMEFNINFALKSPQLTQAQIAARLKTLDAKGAQLQAALKALEASPKAKDPAIVRAFALVNDNGSQILAYANQIAQVADQNGDSVKGLSEALTQIENGMNQVLALYNSVKGIWDGYQAVDVNISALRPPQEKIDLQLLSLEQDHINAISRIKARESIELGTSLVHVETALSRLDDACVSNSAETVESSLRAAAQNHQRDRLVRLLDALHEAAAAAAEEDGARRLAELRLADEQRRYSIRRSSVNSSTYDQTIAAATQRLALYWKSGIKPSDLASSLFFLSNSVALPVFAAR